MIFVNNKEWTGWQKLLGANFKLPKDGVKFVRVNDHEPRMHDQMANGAVIGKIPLAPKGLVVPLSCQMDIDGIMQTVRYAKMAPPINAQGQPEWVTSDLLFDKGEHIVHELSEYWFFKNHAYNRDAAGSQEQKRYFYIEDVLKEANDKVKTEAEAAKASNLLWTISDSDALEVHNIHFKRNASSAAQARLEMKSWVAKTPKEFMDIYTSDVRSTRSVLVQAEKLGIIAYDSGKKNWYWPKEGNKQGEYAKEDVITRIASGRDAHEDLYSFITTKDDGPTVLALIEEQVEKLAEVAV